MSERIASFKYDGAHTREWHEDWLRQLATGRGLELTESKTKTEAIFTPEQVAAEGSWILDKATQAELRQSGKLDLPAEMMSQLCSPVTIKTDTFSSAGSDLKLTIDSTEGNDMPCIGGWLWIEERVILQGGFLLIEADARATVDAIAEAFLAATGRGGARRKS